MDETRTFGLSDIRRLVHEQLASFHIGGAGISGWVDDIQRCLGAVHALEGAEAEMLALCASPNKAVRLYGVLGLKLVKSKAFDSELAKLANDQDIIGTRAGCFVMRAPVWRLATEIANNDVQWLRDLGTAVSQPARAKKRLPARGEMTFTELYADTNDMSDED